MGRPSSSKSVAPFRLILNKSKATAANVYLMLYPKPMLSKAIAQDPTACGKFGEGLKSITGEMFTDEGRIYGGGLHKIEPKELGNVAADFILEAIQLNPKNDSQREQFAV